jgi:transposase
MEATGNFRWFRRLLGELGHEALLGDPAKIHASVVRKQKTDKRNARHILNLLMEDRFPVVWQPPLCRFHEAESFRKRYRALQIERVRC